jgi:hypothetical protein
MSELKVQFGEGRGVVVPLEIRGSEGISSEQLYALLFALRVQILSADEHVDPEEGVVQRLLVCEFDGGPVRFQRRRSILAKLTSGLAAMAAAQAEHVGPGLAKGGASRRTRDRHAA